MSHPESIIQCSNPHCIASNELEADFCNQCSTPIIKRYLWSSKQGITSEQNTSVNNRYFPLSDRIFLDTQPSKPPVTPEEVASEIAAYLQLFPCYPHVPQPYGLLDGTDAWLFDYGTVPTNEREQLAYPQQLIPRLEDLWQEASPLQQLNWLWQIVKLWKPLSSKQVASTLLNRDLIRINGQVVQLLQLQFDREHQSSLSDLGDLWLQWAENAHPQVKDVIKNLASRMTTGAIDRTVQAIAVLDRAISYCQQDRQYSYRVYAQSDSGPSRSNNEDAAYPVSQEISSENALAIVCDGVGGHEGGEIASGKTIEYLQSKISSLTLGEKTSSGKILGKLMKYINGANDIINERNDSEQRHERQRMGTTLVMALASAQEMYLSHVGDSRIYWITPNSCHQITIDDDLASREVRLGYALYRDALQYPSAGALIQALGMRESATLHPNLQRYVIDDDCIFLLCTDGLSDFDRVEQQWKHNILPVLNGEGDLAGSVADLIAIANEKNGHDNVTVALVHCQVRPKPDAAQAAILWSDVESAIEESLLWSDANLADSVWQDPNITDSTSTSVDPTSETEITQQQIPEPIGEPLPAKKTPKWLSWSIWLLVALTVVGLAAYFLLQNNLDPDRSPSLPENELEIE